MRTGSEMESEVLISVITVCEGWVIEPRYQYKKGGWTYAERDAREVVPTERFYVGRCGRGIVNEHGRGAGKSSDKTKCFEALPET